MINLSITYVNENGILRANVSEIQKQNSKSLNGEAKITKDISELGFKKTRNPFQRLVEVNGENVVAVITPVYQ